MILSLSGLLFNILIFILFTAGLFKLFPKCNVQRKYAFIPIYRLYKLAEAIGDKEDGKAWMFIEGMIHVWHIIYLMTSGHPALHVFNSFSSIVVISANAAAFVYSVRIYLCLIRVFRRSVWWVALFIVFRSLAVFIWGFGRSFQPELEEKQHAARISGHEAEGSYSGLTVNISERTVGPRYNSRTLLKDIHLSIRPGRMVMLLGGSGAGKTTFLNAITGYEPADASIVLNGRDVYREFDKLKYDIAFVPQQDTMRSHDTVYWTVADSASLRVPVSVSKNELHDRISGLIASSGLDSVKNNLVAKQSGGQRKRISIAMEFVSDPYLFILDEPDSGLDGVLAREMMENLREISRKGRIVIVITHSPDRVSEFFDDVIILAKDADMVGRLVYYGGIGKAKEFFSADSFEEVIRKINRKEEGGEGLADELIEKFEKERGNA